jgi:16S rRNA G1207 methylase RsmC
LERDGSDLYEEIKLKTFPYKKLRTANALWFVLKKTQKLRTTLLELRTANVGLETQIYNFEAVFSGEKRDFLSPFLFRHLSTDWRGDPKQERRGKTSLEKEFEGELKNRVRNRRFS